MESICFRPPPSFIGIPTPPVSLEVRATHNPLPPPNAVGRSTVEAPLRPATPWYVFTRPQWRLWPPGKEEGVTAEESAEREGEECHAKGRNWVSNVLLLKSLRGRKDAGSCRDGGVVETEKDVSESDEFIRRSAEEGDRCVGCCEVEEEEKKVVFDQRSFTKLLKRVSLAEASLYRRLSHLGLLAYSVSKIKCGNLLRSRGLRFVSSSLERRSLQSDSVPEEQCKIVVAQEVTMENENGKKGVPILVAPEITASAASFLNSRNSQPGASDGEKIGDFLCSESFAATTNSVTSVVAAEEEVKEAVAKDLNSPQSSPCEWFVCDDESSRTRYFVIQGSESLASWRANIFFEPIQFEGLEFVVHRGIYEAAKGIYKQMLPEVRAHLESHGKSAKLQFTGHSLGGSLSLLVNLMLLIRGEAAAASLLPVVTFGAPTILCGGNQLLKRLGLPLSHVQAIMMHRDIVPRAFSCNFPDHVAEILKALNKNFRNHSCLTNKKLLYEPMGQLLILQPDEKSSPYHELLPRGSGLYAFVNSDTSQRLVQAAQSFFMNSPHPLEILSNHSAYGSNGTIHRDHDMNTYVRSVHSIVRIEVKRIRRAEIERRRKMWAAVVVMEGTSAADTVVEQPAARTSLLPQPVWFAGALRSGLEPLKRFGRLVASQHVHLLVMMMLPAQVMIMKALAVVSLS